MKKKTPSGPDASKTNRIAVLASTNGTDLQTLIDAIEGDRLDAHIGVVISNKECGALEKARARGIPSVCLSSEGKTREAFDREVSHIIESYDSDLILLIGYMRLLSDWFVMTYRHRVMNIHPSLLPAFAGGMDKDVHAAVLKAGVKETGCTLHFVDESVDGGPIILQKKVNVAENETVDSLKEKVQKAEQEVIVKALKLYEQDKIKVDNGKVTILK